MLREPLRDARILIVDDDAANVGLVETALREAGYVHLRGLTDPRQVLPLFDEFKPDLMILDLCMPHLDGFAVMRELRACTQDFFFPILAMIDVSGPGLRVAALEGGAREVMSKPIDPVKTALCVRNLLDIRTFQEAAQVEILERLAMAAEFRDDDTGQHAQRVGKLAGRIARVMGFSDPQARILERAAPLHDIGKVGIPDAILLKPGRLTPEEFEIIKTHTSIGARLLSGSRFPVLQMAEVIALTHHENWDGTGYSPGLAGEAIPLVSRIVSVADVYDALTSERLHKRAWTRRESIAEIVGTSGTKFDRRVVDAFLTVMAQGGAVP